MRAWGLTISLPSTGCEKKCPYCISRITGYVDYDEECFYKNIRKAIVFAKNSGIENVLLTSKLESFLSAHIPTVISLCDEYPIEIQTNGIALYRHFKEHGRLEEKVFGLNTIAFSIHDLRTLDTYSDMMQWLYQNGYVVRVCLNITDKIPEMSFDEIFDYVSHFPAHHILFRQITFPQKHTDCPEISWIKEHCPSERFLKLYQEFNAHVEHQRPTRVFPFGMKVYGVNGISVAFSGECVQETFSNDDLRSLIFLEDGHLYTSWSDRSTIII